MKTILTTLLLSIGLVTAACANEQTKTDPEQKKVCVKILDNKTNKEVEKCKVMKMHKKHEGTAVPEDKKKK